MASPHRDIEPPALSYRFGDFELDLSDETLLYQGRKLLINHRMFQVLCLLIGRRGEIVSKTVFFEKVWGGNFVEDNNLTVTMTALRKVLGDDPKQPSFIENLPRRGYRFIAPVTDVGLPATGDGNTTNKGVESEPFSKSHRWGRLGIAAAVVVIAVTVAAVGYKGYWTSIASKGDRIDSIVVLPFESRQPDNEYLADGLTDGIINSLSRLSGVRVIDRNSAFKYKNKTIDPAEVGRELNVRSVVTGQIERVDDTLTITAELTDMTGNSRSWRQQFTRNKAELIAVQLEIVQTIIKDFVSKPDGQQQIQQSKRPTNNAEAYDLYLKGRYYWNKRANPDLLRSIDLFRATIDKDPTFAKAYVGLGEAYALAQIDGIDADERVKLAQGAVQRALEIDDTIGEAYAVIGITKTYQDWDFQGAESAYLRALELNPNDATTRHWYAEFLSMDGRFDESYRQYDIALSLDPLSLPIRTDTAYAHYVARDYDTAIEILNKSKELAPEYGRTFEFLGFAYREKEMFDESVHCMEKRFTLQFQPGERSKESYDVAMKYAADLRASATKTGARGFWEAEQRSGPTDPIYKAVAYSKLGETDRAFESLEKAFTAHYTGMVWLKVQPEFDGIRSDPRYPDLLRRIGFRSE